MVVLIGVAFAACVGAAAKGHPAVCPLQPLVHSPPAASRKLATTSYLQTLLLLGEHARKGSHVAPVCVTATVHHGALPSSREAQVQPAALPLSLPGIYTREYMCPRAFDTHPHAQKTAKWTDEPGVGLFI